MKRITFLIALSFFLSGCALTDLLKTPGSAPTSLGNAASGKGIYKSVNGGQAFEAKNTIDERNNIGGADVLTIEIDPNDQNKVFIGTVASGIYRSDNAGDTWKKINTAQRCYAIAINPKNTQEIYLTGVIDGRGKIVKSSDGGENWIELYSEPAGEFVIASLVIDPYDPNVLYAGDSRGQIIKSVNAGQEWQSIGELDGPITKISLDAGDTRNVYLGVHDRAPYKIDFSHQVKDDKGSPRVNSSNRITDGPIILNLQDQMRNIRGTGNLLELVADPKRPGVVYFSNNSGILISLDGGNSWSVVPTVEGPGDIPIRALSIGGDNSEIIYFASRGAVYKSTDYGRTWAAIQFNTGFAIEALKLNPGNRDVVYLGIRELNGT